MPLAWCERAVFSDVYDANRETEPRLGRLPASLFQPGCVIVRAGDDQHLVGGKPPQRIFDRFHRVGISDLGFHVRCGRSRRGLVRQGARFCASIVLGVSQSIESRNVRCGSHHKHLSIVAREMPGELIQLRVRDFRGDYDKQTTRHLSAPLLQEDSTTLSATRGTPTTLAVRVTVAFMPFARPGGSGCEDRGSLALERAPARWEARS